MAGKSRSKRMESALWERLRTIGHSARPGTHFPSRMTLRWPDVRYPQLGYAFSSKRAMSRRRTPAWSRRLEPAYYRSESAQRGMSAEGIEVSAHEALFFTHVSVSVPQKRCRSCCHRQLDSNASVPSHARAAARAGYALGNCPLHANSKEPVV